MNNLIFFIKLICVGTSVSLNSKTDFDEDMQMLEENPLHIFHGILNETDFMKVDDLLEEQEDYDVQDGILEHPEEIRFVLRLLLEESFLRFHTVSNIIDDNFGIGGGDVAVAAFIVDNHHEKYTNEIKVYSTKLVALNTTTLIENQNRALDLLDFGNDLALSLNKQMLDKYHKDNPSEYLKHKLYRADTQINEFYVRYKKEALVDLCAILKICRYIPSFAQNLKGLIEVAQILSHDKILQLRDAIAGYLHQEPIPVKDIIGDKNFNKTKQLMNDNYYEVKDLRTLMKKMQKVINLRHKFVKTKHSYNKTAALRVLMNVIDEAFMDNGEAFVDAFFRNLTSVITAMSKNDYDPKENENAVEQAVNHLKKVLNQSWTRNAKEEVQYLVAVVVDEPRNETYDYLLTTGPKYSTRHHKTLYEYLGGGKRMP